MDKIYAHVAAIDIFDTNANWLAWHMPLGRNLDRKTAAFAHSATDFNLTLMNIDKMLNNR